ncbi:MAG: hypothetical protein ACTHOH_16155 [Lysobacteraceae bacterium]
MSLQTRIRALETLGAGRVLVLSAASLTLDLLPMLHDVLRTRDRSSRLCVMLQCEGGDADAARRIALRLHASTDRLVLLPDRCEAAGTLLALAAHAIVAGPTTRCAPVMPSLPIDGPDGPTTLSARDLRDGWRVVRDEHGLDEAEARTQALRWLATHVFPTTLTAFHRHAQELARIGDALLALADDGRSAEARAAIVQALMQGDDAVASVLDADALRRLGLPVVDIGTLAPPIQDAWRALREGFGSGAWHAAEEDACDALIATADGVQRRRQRPHAPSGLWEQAA